MFDPTTFDNMKVVLEGALYDLDLHGEIAIKDRNDFMNLAKLSRKYEITFSRQSSSKIDCTLILEAALENLAAELKPSSLQKGLIGAEVKVFFTFHQLDKEDIHKRMEEELVKIWGDERRIEQTASYSPLARSPRITKNITILFNRLILEEQMDDLVRMLDYILASIDVLEHILNESDRNI